MGGVFACSFDAYVSGDAADPDHVNAVTAAVADDEGNQAADTDAATVSFGDAMPAVDVAKHADPGSVPPVGSVPTMVQMAATVYSVHSQR